MKNVIISDMTLKLQGAKKDKTLSFKEKIELAKCFDKMQVDVIEMPAIENERTDSLLIKTICPFIKNSVISVDAGKTVDQANLAAEAVKNAEKARLCVALPVSPVQMEYLCHKKPAAMMEYIKEMVSICAKNCGDVEFCALDATRAEADFLKSVIETVISCGATMITLSDSEGLMLPEEMAEFIKNITSDTDITWGFETKNTINMASACAISALKNNISVIKTAVEPDYLSPETFSQIIRAKGEQIGLKCNIDFTVMSRLCSQISWILQGENSQIIQSEEKVSDDNMKLTSSDDITTIIGEVRRLGYDLSEEDNAKVYEAFCHVAAKKDMTISELEAIVATTALQVPPTYKVKSYVINSGNIINATATIELEKNGEILMGLSAGDGPVDSAFRAIEQIIGCHYELDDFQIQSVTRGKEAMGSALVRLRSNGRLYSGNGISTDIIGASIRAYVNALNKIVYEETQK
ncbi:MAG: hypothetical protein IKZ25_03300 [Clostridia bacterium]|nr:hypothetical protein [Clostridia bacterium]